MPHDARAHIQRVSQLVGLELSHILLWIGVWETLFMLGLTKEAWAMAV